MSKSVDERVVQMKFDNRDFEKNVQESVGTLEKLKRSLDFSKTEKDISGLQNSFDKIDVNNFNEALNRITDHFTILGRVSDQVIRRIADGLFNAALQGYNFVKSLTIDQIGKGWDKFMSKTESIQTIMNATGADIDEVNYYLNKMMWFSDETSYGFTGMASALGQMTSAGGDMEKLVPMIMGVANATAYAGKGPQEFARAIYNLNQSYSSGALKYMDWKSLEMAGVASKQLKQTLIDTAVAMGKLKKGEVTLANFNDTLKDDWADQAVMEAAFGKFAMATEEAYKLVKEQGEFDTASEAYDALAGQFDEIYYRAARAAQEAKNFQEVIDATKDAVSSGWMRTFELIFGNYEEAKVLWTDMANAFWEIFAQGAESRNELLEEWHDAQVGGYKDFTETINIFLQTIIDAKEILGDIVYDILPDIDTPNLQNFVMKFKELGKEANAFFTGDMPKFEGITAELAKTLGFASKKDALATLLPDAERRYKMAISNGAYFREAVAGAASAVNILRKGLITLQRSLSPLLKIVSAFWRFTLQVLAGLSKVIRYFDQSIEATNGFRDSVDWFATKVATALETAGDAVYSFFNALFYWDEATEKFVFAGGILDMIQKKFDELGQSELGKAVVDALTGIKDLGMIILGGIQWLFNQIPNMMPYIIDGLTQICHWAAQGAAFIGRMFTEAKNWLISTDFIEFGKGIWETVKEFITPAIGKIKEFFATLTVEKVKQDLGGILTFLGKAFSALGEFLSPVVDVLKELWGYITAGNFEGFKNLMSGILQGGGLIGILRLSSGGKNFLDSFAGIGDAIDELLGRFAGRERVGNIILKIAIGLAILTASLWSLSGIDADGIINASVALGSILFILTTFIKSLNKLSSEGMLSGEKRGLFGTAKTFFSSPISQISTDLIKMGIALIFFAKAIQILAKIDSKGLTNAIMTLGMLFLMIGVFSKVMNGLSSGTSAMTKGKGGGGLGGLLLKVGAAVALIGAGLLLFAGAVKLLGTMDENAILHAEIMILMFVAAFTAMAIVGEKFSAGLDNLWKTLLAGALAMLIVAPAIVIFTGCIAALSLLPIGNMAAATLAIIGLIAGLGFALKKFNFKNSASLLMVSIAIKTISNAISLLGRMKVGQVILGVAAIAATLLVLSATLKQLSMKHAEVFLALALGMTAMGLAMQILGSLEWEQILKALVALAGALLVFSTFKVTIVSASGGISALSGALLGFALALLAVTTALTLLALIGKEKGRQLLSDIRDLAPDLQKTIVAIVNATCGAITEAFPTILETIGILLNDFIDWLTKAIEGPDGLIEKAVVLIIKAIGSLAASIHEHKKEIVDAVKSLVSEAIDLVLDLGISLATELPIVGDIIVAALKGMKALLSGTVGGTPELQYGVYADQYKATGSKQYLNSIVEGMSSENEEEREAAIAAYEELYEWAQEHKDDAPRIEVKRDWEGNIIYDDMGQEVYEVTWDSAALAKEVISHKPMYGFGGFGGKDHYVSGYATQALSSALTGANLDAWLDDHSYAIQEFIDSHDNLINYAEKFPKQLYAALSKVSSDDDAVELLKTLSGILEEKGEEAGKQFIAGLIRGLLNPDGTAKLERASKSAATLVDATTRLTLQVKSPSRLSEEIGMYWDQGLANGLVKYSSGVETTSEAISNSIVDSFTIASKSISDFLKYGASKNIPAIQPILSIGNRKAFSDLGNAMNDQTEKVSALAKGKGLHRRGDLVDGGPVGNTTKNYGDFTINVYAAEGQNPKDIAAYVMDEIQSEMERREAALA